MEKDINIKCDLCGNEVKLSEKIRIKNKINGNKLDICKECVEWMKSIVEGCEEEKRKIRR